MHQAVVSPAHGALYAQGVGIEKAHQVEVVRHDVQIVLELFTRLGVQSTGIDRFELGVVGHALLGAQGRQRIVDPVAPKTVGLDAGQAAQLATRRQLLQPCTRRQHGSVVTFHQPDHHLCATLLRRLLDRRGFLG